MPNNDCNSPITVSLDSPCFKQTIRKVKRYTLTETNFIENMIYLQKNNFIIMICFNHENYLSFHNVSLLMPLKRNHTNKRFKYI